MTTRREILQYLVISLGGTALLSSCGGNVNVVATPSGIDGRFYNEQEMALVARLSDLIIPQTETPGALDVNVPGYLDGLMVDWASAETQEKHRRDLAIIRTKLNVGAAGDFLRAKSDAARKVLATFDAQAFAGGDELAGYRELKGYIAAAYFATKEGALDELKWVAVPGRWDPSINLIVAE